MAEIRSEVVDGGYRLVVCRAVSTGLLRRRISWEPLDDWSEGLRTTSPVAASIIDELESAGKLTSVGNGARFLSFESAAELPNADAEMLNLLDPFPYELDVHSKGALGNAKFEVDYYASQGGVRVYGSFSDGLFVESGKRFRISGLIYSVIRAIELAKSAQTAEEKIAAFASLRLLLPEDGGGGAGVHAESYLLRMRIGHVNAIGLNPSIVDGHVSFDPIPMKRRDAEDYEAGAEMAIAPVACERFADEFRSQARVNSTYVLKSGHYLYVDPSVRTALRVVKEKQSAATEDRLAFLMSPSRAITEAYRREGIDSEEVPIGDTIFFETSEYSDRIVGIGEWIPPQLSYLEREENSWLPERFSVVLGDKLVTGKPDDIGDWIDRVKEAQSAKKLEVMLGDVAVATDTPGLLATLQKLQPPEAMPREVPEKAPEASAGSRRKIRVLQTKSNFDEHEFKRQFRKRALGKSSSPIMRVGLKEHQIAGVAWITSCFLTGWPGVLLADDMGLGKTLQSLTFLTLLRRERVIRKGRPALVVAPTSLLRNWQDEHDKHALGDGLGRPLVAFGKELRNLRVGRAAEDDVVLLDSEQLAGSNWVLTTYETVRDYHLSFARVRFSVVVLDEIQKAKNPTTRINATLKALNPDFVLAMTGTPVENSISDLWAITDIVAPGYLPPLKEFMRAYGKNREPVEREAALKKLSSELLEFVNIDGAVVPPYALRRLKEDVAKDLPAKHEGPMLRRFMPAVQAERYAEVSASTQAGKIEILRALHDFRSISLHPVDPESFAGGYVSDDEYISMSARLSLAFEKLASIAERNEKAIIFVNSRRIQSVLSRLIERKFGCARPEFIRGDTIPGQRQEIVNRFSELDGFAVLILSPRAAGVGLNIVAANHVIHLDRWWNPAVEDQCTDRAYRIGATKDVYVHTVGAVHPVLQDSSYDIVLDGLLRGRREVSKRIFTSSEITAADFGDAFMRPDSARGGEDILKEIDRDGYLRLEEFVRDRLLAEGFLANLTKRVGDGGADIVVKDEVGEIIYLVQCKHTTNIESPIDAGILEDARRVRNNWRANNAMVIGVSNAAKFAPRVIAEFERINGRLISRDGLRDLHFR